MSIEQVAAAAVAPMPDMQQTMRAGYGASVADIQGFQGELAAQQGGSVQNAPTVSEPIELSPALKSVFSQLERVNGEAKQVSDYAQAATQDGQAMTPGEVVQLTVRCHEFMFHCQLSSNIANRTSDGLQQLFRQQS